MGIFSLNKDHDIAEPLSRLYISLDNTASGLQILTLLVGAKNKSLNLTVQDKDSLIEDCYGKVAVASHIRDHLSKVPSNMNLSLKKSTTIFITKKINRYLKGLYTIH